MTVLGEMGVQNLDIGFTAPKGTLFGVFCVKIGACILAVAVLKTPRAKIAESLCADAEGREITHVQK